MISLWFGVFLVFALGIILAYYHLVALALVIALGLAYVAIFADKYSRAALWGLLLLVLAWFYFDLTVLPRVSQLPAHNNTTLEGRVQSLPRFDGRTASFVLAADHQIDYRKKIQVFCFFDPGLRQGDRVSLRGDLKPPASPGNPGELDYADYLRQNQIYYILSIKDKNAVKLISRSSGLAGWLVNYQLQARGLFHQILSQDDANILLGMLLGIVEGIDPDEYRDYQKTGIIHVFSVSGMHIGFLLLLAAWVTSLLGLSKKSRLVVGLALLFIYGGLTGWPTPVLRSAIMGALGLIAYYSGRENQLLNSLGLAGVIILLLNPTSLWQISFQLTFLAAWGLVYIFPLVKKRLAYRCRFWDLILVPLCAQAPMLPLLIYHFNLFSPVSLLSNILLGYLSGAAVVLGFLALIVSGSLPFLAGVFLNPAGLMIEMVRYINHFLVQLPGAFFWVATPGIITIMVYYLGLFLVIYTLARKKNQRLLPGGALLMAVFILMVFIPASFYNRGIMEVVFIDVGQGDSILLKTPQGKFILIDGGGSEFSDIAHRKLLPYLHYRGIREIWLELNTHPDTDHLQGLEEVLAEMPVRCAAIPASLNSSEKYKNYMSALTRKQVPLVELKQGQVLNIEEGLRVDVLYPNQDSGEGDANDQSVVLLCRYGSFSTLLTGDLGQQPLQYLVAANKFNPVTALKIPHHGSKGSLSAGLYDQTQPKWAVISVGANNRFGHPHPLVLEALEQRHIKVFRTDLNGAITIKSNGRTSEVKCYR